MKTASAEAALCHNRHEEDARIRLSARFFRYNLVGAMGLAVKFSTLTFLVEIARLGYLWSTALAVETALLHGFAWHLSWTWRDRSRLLTVREILARLLRFQLGTGAVAMTTNLLAMYLLVEGLGLHYFPSNVVATALAGIANFILAEYVVFVAPERIPSCRR